MGKKNNSITQSEKEIEEELGKELRRERKENNHRV